MTVTDKKPTPEARRTRLTHYYLPDTPAEKLPAALTSGQAAIWLDISRKKMAKLLNTGAIRRIPGLDNRYVMVSTADVVALRAQDVRFIQADDATTSRKAS